MRYKRITSVNLSCCCWQKKSSAIQCYHFLRGDQYPDKTSSPFECNTKAWCVLLKHIKCQSLRRKKKYLEPINWDRADHEHWLFPRTTFWVLFLPNDIHFECRQCCLMLSCRLGKLDFKTWTSLKTDLILQYLITQSKSHIATIQQNDLGLSQPE